MKIFRFSVSYDQPIVEWFNQDDAKTIGHRRVQALLTVVAPDKELAEFFARRSFMHKNAELALVKEEVINLFVQGSGQTVAMISDAVPIGAEVLNDLGRRLKEKHR